MLRKTAQRDAIRQALVEAGRPLAPIEIAKAAESFAPGIGIATVYRTIKKFLEQGWLEAIDLPGEPPRYEVAGKVHHHHFQCRVCEGVFEIPGCDVKVASVVPEGFELEEHELVLYGRCASCATGRPKKPTKHKH